MTKISKYIIALIFTSMIFLISEGLYQFRNNPSVRLYGYLGLSRFYLEINDVNRALTYFDKAYESRLVQLSNQTSQEVKKEKVLAKLPDNQRLVSEYKLILINLDINKLINSYDIWGKILYNLGLSAYRNGETDLVIPFWQKAIAIAPEWSYFYIELANYYFIEGKKDEAKAILDQCLSFDNPKSFCQWYIDNHMITENPEAVGFLEEKINKDIR